MYQNFLLQILGHVFKKNKSQCSCKQYQYFLEWVVISPGFMIFFSPLSPVFSARNKSMGFPEVSNDLWLGMPLIIWQWNLIIGKC